MASAEERAANGALVIHVADLVLDLILAAILGGAIGIQRQAAHKPAGFRTHLLVALASCAFAEIGRLSGDDRITANVLTGIGFLGAGVIFRSGLTAHGLTTAASVWTVAAIGVAVGYGQPYSLAIGLAVAVITLGVLLFSDRMFNRLFVEHANVKILCTDDAAAALMAAFEAYGAHFHPAGEYRIKNSESGKMVQVEYHIVLPRAGRLGELVQILAGIPGIHDVSSRTAAPSSV